MTPKQALWVGGLQVFALLPGVSRSGSTIAAGLGLARAQAPTITPNYVDADIRKIIEAVSEVTGRNFLIDPRVKAQVTMLSSSPMSPDAFYQAFLSILEVHGYVAVPSGPTMGVAMTSSPMQYTSRTMPPMPVAAPSTGMTWLGWLWLSWAKMMP